MSVHSSACTRGCPGAHSFTLLVGHNQDPEEDPGYQSSSFYFRSTPLEDAALGDCQRRRPEAPPEAPEAPEAPRSTKIAADYVEPIDRANAGNDQPTRVKVERNESDLSSNYQYPAHPLR